MRKKEQKLQRRHDKLDNVMPSFESNLGLLWKVLSMNSDGLLHSEGNDRNFVDEGNL